MKFKATFQIPNPNNIWTHEEHPLHLYDLILTRNPLRRNLNSKKSWFSQPHGTWLEKSNKLRMSLSFYFPQHPNRRQIISHPTKEKLKIKICCICDTWWAQNLQALREGDMGFVFFSCVVDLDCIEPHNIPVAKAYPHVI